MEMLGYLALLVLFAFLAGAGAGIGAGHARTMAPARARPRRVTSRSPAADPGVHLGPDRVAP